MYLANQVGILALPPVLTIAAKIRSGVICLTSVNIRILLTIELPVASVNTIRLVADAEVKGGASE